MDNPMKTRNYTISKGFVSGLLFFLLTGCTVGTLYERPQDLPIPSGYETQAEQFSAESVNSARWWEAFDDEILVGLVDQAQRNNLDLRQGALRIVEARAIRGGAKSALLPSVDLVGTALKTEASEHSLSLAANATQYQLGAEIGWELDFWGRIRRSIESADAQLLATEADFNDFRTIIATEVANTYIQLRAAEIRLGLAEESVQIQEKLLSNTRAQFDLGEGTKLDVAQAEAIFYDTQALVPALKRQRALARNGLAVLLAIPGNELDTLVQSAEPALPRMGDSINIGVPADLVLQRSDIVAAEFRAISAAAAAGVAEADRRPNISLGGSLLFEVIDGAPTPAGGAQGSDLGDLLSIDSLAYAIAPSINLPIFDGKRRLNNVRAADARYQSSLENLRQAIILALSEVNNAIVSIETAAQESTYLQASVASYALAYETANIQYVEGDIAFTPVLDSLRQRVAQEQRLVLAQSALAAGIVDLFRSLGGGWQDNQIPLLPAETIQQMQQRTNWGGLLGENQ